MAEIKLIEWIIDGSLQLAMMTGAHWVVAPLSCGIFTDERNWSVKPPLHMEMPDGKVMEHSHSVNTGAVWRLPRWRNGTGYSLVIFLSHLIELGFQESLQWLRWFPKRQISSQNLLSLGVNLRNWTNLQNSIFESVWLEHWITCTTHLLHCNYTSNKRMITCVSTDELDDACD